MTSYDFPWLPRTSQDPLGPQNRFKKLRKDLENHRKSYDNQDSADHGERISTKAQKETMETCAQTTGKPLNS